MKSGTYSTGETKSTTITVDSILLAVKKLRAEMDLACSFQKIAREHGFDLTAGDLMIIPGDYADLPKGVVASRLITDIYLLRGGQNYYHKDMVDVFP